MKTIDYSHLVSLRHCSSNGDILEAVTALAGDTALRLQDNSRIIIKPNLSDVSGPSYGFTTDVRVVDALVRHINSHSHPDQIYIVESDSWNRLATEAFDRLGYREIESAHKNVRLVNLTKAPSVNVELPLRSFYNVIRIPRLFMEANFFISVAKLRTHHTVISGILKNQFGCVPQRFKGRYHAYLAEILTNLNLLIRPDWSLVDGLIGGDLGPREVGLLLASRDPVAVDSVCARIMGFDPGKIAHVKRAAAKSVGTFVPELVILDGKPATDLNSIISPKFIGSSNVSLLLGSLGHAITRAADRTRHISHLLVTAAALWTGAAAHPKKELLKMALTPGMLRSYYDTRSSQMSRLQGGN